MMVLGGAEDGRKKKGGRPSVKNRLVRYRIVSYPNLSLDLRLLPRKVKITGQLLYPAPVADGADT
jgi:hypothetical protein